jgi:hypothetical protein
MIKWILRAKLPHRASEDFGAQLDSINGADRVQYLAVAKVANTLKPLANRGARGGGVPTMATIASSLAHARAGGDTAERLGRH